MNWSQCARTIAGLGVVATSLVGCDKPESTGPNGAPPETFVISIAPDGDSVAVGETLALDATVRDARGTVRGDQPVTWAALEPQIASIDNVGLVTGIAAGTAHVTARVGTFVDTATVFVRPGALTLSIAPELVEIVLGDSIQLQANLATPSGAAVQGLSVQWASSDTAVAAIGADGLVTSLTPGDVTLYATVNGASAAALARVIPNPVASVSVTPSNSGIYPGQSVQLVATIRDMRGRPMRNIHVRWASSNPAVANVSSKGLVTGKARGAAIITAITDAMKASATVNVFAVPASGVSLSAPSSTVTLGGQLQAVATVRNADGEAMTGKTIAWSSSNPSVAQVGQTGVITGLTVGSTTIHAVVDSKIGSLPITVVGPTPSVITIIPGTATITLGNSASLTAEVTDQGGNLLTSQSIAWSSDNSAVATVNDAGVVTGVSAGTTTVHARSGALSAQASISVIGLGIASISLTPATVQLQQGGTQRLSAVAYDAAGNQVPNAAIAWSSSNPTIATVSAIGMVTAVGSGYATITASSSGKAASAAVSVASPPPPVVASVSMTFNSPSLTVGQSTQAVAIARDAAGAVITGRAVQWSSDDPALASVSATGLVTAIASGSATIVAKIDGVAGIATLTVAAAAPLPVHTVQLTIVPSSIQTGQQASSNVVLRDSLGKALTGYTIGWSSSKPAIASVGLGGVVTGVSSGSATITASSSGKSGSAGVAVASSGPPSVASVSVSASPTALTPGQHTQATATVRDSVGNPISGYTVSWTSSNPTAASVSSTGLITALVPGVSTITASAGGRSGTLMISVLAPTVGSVTLSLPSANLTIGQKVQATASAKDAAGNPIPGAAFAWLSSNSSVATVSSTGLVTAIAAGTANISATSSGKAAVALVTVVGSGGGGGGGSGTVPSIPAALPQMSVSTGWVAPTGRTLTVNAGGNLQAALDSAKRGDEVVLQAGATFTGNFMLKAKPGSGWVTVRTSNMASLPPLGGRVSSANYSAMAKLVSPNINAVLATAANASGWRLVGLEMTIASGVAVFPNANYGIVLLGDGSSAQKTASAAARDLILDRVYIHGQTNTNTTRCVGLNAGATAIIGSHLLECHAKGFDAQAVGGWNGPGPYLIENNRLEASGEVIMFGGSDPAIPNLISSDITIRRNYLTRPMSWQGQWTVKNLFELKNAQRVLLEANVLENHWVDAQAGSAIVLGSVNQGGYCTWCVVQDVTFRYNHVNRVAGVFNIFARCGRATPNGSYGCDQGAQQTRRIKIEQNLFTNVGVPGLNAGGSAARIYMLQSDVHDIWIERNTGFAPYSYLTFSGGGATAKQRFTFRENIGGNSQYNFFSSQGQGDAAASSSLTAPYHIKSNGFVGTGLGTLVPSGSMLVSNLSSVGFANAVWPGGDWSLGSSSAFAGVGVNFASLQAQTAGVAQ